MIKPKSSRLTWPKPRVSRTGSIATASGTAMPTVNQSDQPSRSTIGLSSAARTTAEGGDAGDHVQPAGDADRQIFAIGSMTSPAKGG